MRERKSPSEKMNAMYVRMAKMIAAYDVVIRPSFVRAIAYGYKRPRYELADILWKITGIPIATFMTWERGESAAA